MKGFTLVELAIVLGLITLLLGSILVPLQSQVESRKLVDTQKMLDNAREMLIGYAAANGRFPCPATSTSNGLESFASGGSTANGNCSTFLDGYLPAATLGFTPIDSSGYALDAYNNRIRYVVSNQTLNLITNPFTATSSSTAGMKAATISSIASNQLFVVCASGSGPPTTGPPLSCGGTVAKLTDNAPVVIWSTGANAGTTGGASTDEKQNPNPDPTSAGYSADRFFVYHVPSTVTGSEFDDLMTWISVGVLVNRMLAAGQLP